MNEKARKFRIARYRCMACLLYLERGNLFLSGETRVHYNCGGFVVSIRDTKMPELQEAWRDRVAEMDERLAEEGI